MRSHILITGGTGVIGPAIINRLNRHDCKLTILYRNNIPLLKVPGIWRKVDFADTGLSLGRFLSDVDIVIHNAASIKPGNTQSEIEDIHSFNFEFTERLFRSACESGVKKIVFTSTLSLLKKPFNATITETDAIEPISYYARSKYYAERLLKSLYEEVGLGYNILRVSSPVSNDISTMHNTVLRKWIMEAKEGKDLNVYGTGNRTQDFVSITDIAEAFLLCIVNKQVNGVFNIASGTSISMLELARIIAEEFDVRFQTEGIDQNESEHWNISIEKARRILGYRPEYDSVSAIRALLNTLKR